MNHLFGSPTSRVGKQTKREEDCSKTLAQKRFEDFVNSLWKTCRIILSALDKKTKKDVGTWRAPKRVNIEQNMQWRRQGVNKESATVITCIDFMLQLFQLDWFVLTMIPSPTEKQVMAPFQA